MAKPKPKKEAKPKVKKEEPKVEAPKVEKKEKKEEKKEVYKYDGGKTYLGREVIKAEEVDINGKTVLNLTVLDGGSMRTTLASKEEFEDPKNI